MNRRELAAAGITDPELRRSYERCRRLNADHGRTYYLATLLLPPAKRPYVHALYGFARYADDIVDRLDPEQSGAERTATFERWSAQVRADLASGTSTDPVCRALVDTIRRWDIPLVHFTDFLTSMQMDLTVTEYATDADLLRYMRGSAAAIGLQMLPILGAASAASAASAAGATDPDARAARAADLGVAFQLTNFLRDIAEDLRRGRVYLPQESLRRFDVDRSQLEKGVINGPIRALLAYEIDRTRQIYARASTGIELVETTSRPCLRAAFALYGAILDEIERADYDVFSRRVSVSRWRRARVAARGLVQSWLIRARFARRPSHTQPESVASTRQNPKSRSSTGA